MDILGHILRITPPFRGKHRLLKAWFSTLGEDHCQRLARLPNGCLVATDLAIPYERMIWLQQEEWNDLNWLIREISFFDLFVDVGSNVGIWTLSAAPTTSVISIEPNPETFQKLEANVARNGLGNKCRLIQAAVTQEAGEVHFEPSPMHNLSAISVPSQRSIRVKAIALDDLIGDLTANSTILIKMDTEGHETEAIKGAVRIIERFRPAFILEFNTTLLKSNVLADWKPFKVLRQMGYRAFEYSKKKADPIDGSFVFDGYTNLLFRPD